MLNNKNDILVNLRRLGLNNYEAKVYLALVNEPLTHLEVARRTGINRTKVYRIEQDLKLRGLINTTQRDDGKFLAAADPTNLEIDLVSEEENLKAKRSVLNTTIQAITQLAQSNTNKDFFSIDTYEGVSGIRQMLWNELKTKGEICAFVHETLDHAAGRRWAEKYRATITNKAIPHRVLENVDSNHVLETTQVENYKDIYKVRYLSRSILDIKQEMTIHDDTVSIYNWGTSTTDEKVGLEIHNQQFADFIKSMFETYWKLAK